MTIPEVSVSDAAARVRDGAFLLDVRNDDEWAAGHSPDAHYVTLQQVPTRAGEVPNDRAVMVVCRAGGRSAQATEWLVANGYDAHNVLGGMQAWAAAGLPVVTDDGGPGAVI